MMAIASEIPMIDLAVGKNRLCNCNNRILLSFSLWYLLPHWNTCIVNCLGSANTFVLYSKSINYGYNCLMFQSCCFNSSFDPCSDNCETHLFCKTYTKT